MNQISPEIVLRRKIIGEPPDRKSLFYIHPDRNETRDLINLQGCVFRLSGWQNRNLKDRTKTILDKGNPQRISIELHNHAKNKYQDQLECKNRNDQKNQEVGNGERYEAVLCPVKPVNDHQSQAQKDLAEDDEFEKCGVPFIHAPKRMNNNHQEKQ